MNYYEQAEMMDIWRGLPDGIRPRLTGDQVHMNPLGNIVMARTALLALGVPAGDLDAAWPKVKQAIADAAPPAK